MTMLEVSLCLSLFIVSVILFSTASYDFYEQQLNYNLLKQRQADLQQLTQDHPDQWWYKTDLNMTNTLLEMYNKSD